MQIRIIFPLVLLLSAALSWWFVTSLDFTALEEPENDTRKPDYFMHGVRTVVMDKKGKPKQELYANFLAHYKKENRTELTQPNLTVHRADGSVWTVTAETGTIYDEMQEILLQGSVLIEQEKSNVTIKAQDITIYPQTHTAETNNAVTIVSSESTVQAKGMHADFKQLRLRLDAKVKGTYVQ